MLFWECQFRRDQRSQFNKETFFKNIFCYGIFKYVSTLRKSIFLAAPWKFVIIYGSNNLDSVVFRNEGFEEIKDHSLTRTLVQKSFRYVSTLRKKVFSRALVKCFFLFGSNNSDSLVLGNAGFGEIKDHSLTTTDFFKVLLPLTFLLEIKFPKQSVWCSKKARVFLGIGCFFEYPEYPEYLFPNIQLKTMC